jgi:hypothetical protein
MLLNTGPNTLPWIPHLHSWKRVALCSSKNLLFHSAGGGGDNLRYNIVVYDYVVIILSEQRTAIVMKFQNYHDCLIPFMLIFPVLLALHNHPAVNTGLSHIQELINYPGKEVEEGAERNMCTRYTRFQNKLYDF